MTRIVAGAAGGRSLVVPRGETTRPTSDRVREAVFSRLDALGAVRGAAVLDLFAGSGALGLEAASRGAASVLLVERAVPALAACRRNARELGLAGVQVRAGAVLAVLAAGAPQPFDLVLADPPYPLGEDELVAVLVALVEGGWLAPDALLVLERSARSPEPRWPGGLLREHHRRYGETAIWSAGPDPGRG